MNPEPTTSREADNIEIRQASRYDEIEGLAELRRTIHWNNEAHTFQGFNPRPSSDVALRALSLRRSFETLRCPQSLVLVAVSGTNILAFATWLPPFENAALEGNSSGNLQFGRVANTANDEAKFARSAVDFLIACEDIISRALSIDPSQRRSVDFTPARELYDKPGNRESLITACATGELEYLNGCHLILRELCVPDSPEKERLGEMLIRHAMQLAETWHMNLGFQATRSEMDLMGTAEIEWRLMDISSLTPREEYSNDSYDLHTLRYDYKDRDKKGEEVATICR